MNKRVLITFGSKYGSTAEIAKKIGEVLQESGLDTDVAPAKSANKPDTYDAVILGSGVYIGNWRKEAAKFLKANQTVLKTKPVWIFSSGPTGEGEPLELVKGWQVPKKLKETIDSIQPCDITVFHGDINVNKLTALHKWMIGKVESPVGDFRNWDMISTWAARIAETLKK